MKKLILGFAILFFYSHAYTQTSGGPDAYGYTWKNSNHSTSPPSYSWVDISSKGTLVNGLADDNVVGPITPPAGFQFYWYPISKFWIGSNGYISFNGANMASPFPASIPSTAGANDWVALHLSDLNFAGANNPGKCYYYMNNDSIVISYHNVPYWNVSTGYSGSNTFQVIFSSIDKSITCNYKSMNAGSTTLPIDNAIGIENITGSLGLQAQIDVVPGNNFTIKYYYPSNVTYSVTDGGVNWNNNEDDGGYFISVSNTPYYLKSSIKNFGNQPLGSFTVTDTIYSGVPAVSNGSATVSGLAPGSDTTILFSNAFYAQFSGTFRFASRVQGINGDLVPANNRKVQKIKSINTNVAQYILDYSDGTAEGSLSWNGGNGGVGVYFMPPKYPARIDATRFHIASNSATTPQGFSAMIFDDSGPNGSPGNLLDSVFVPPTSVQVGLYNTVQAQDTTIYLSSGGVYVAWYMGGADIGISSDNNGPASGRTFEILGTAWADYRSKLTEDFLIGVSVSTPPFPQANFQVDSSMSPTMSFTDVSTNSPTKWYWDFGTGDTSAIQNPAYTYTANGSYTVCLAATNNLGTDTVCKTVRVRGIGIDEVHLSDDIFVYPNPASDIAYLDIPAGLAAAELVLEVFSVTGQHVLLPYVVDSNRLVLKTKNLTPGNYLIQITKPGDPRRGVVKLEKR